MKHFVLTVRNLPFSLAFTLCLFAWTAAHAQITPLGDSYINTAASTTNYGAKTLLDVDGATQTTYIQFNLGSVPATASVSQATLKIYVNTVTSAGSFNVDYVNGAWTESTIDASNAPPLGAAIASNVSVTSTDKNQYILVNVTSAVQAWLSGSETNNGLALVANSSFDATFDSKENTTTSHPPELDISFGGGSGTITGVETGPGSGLTGGGTSGTLNLSLTTACASGQVLSWNGSAWNCSSAGTGTITGVTAGTDLTGGGTSGNVTLSLNTSALNSSYAQLAVNNTFTGNQTVNGNVSATGVVTGSSYQIGSNLFAFGSYANANAFVGFAGNTSMTGTGNSGNGIRALVSNTTGAYNTAQGMNALYSNTTANYSTAVGAGALYTNTTGTSNTALGLSALYYNTTGGLNTALGVNAMISNTTASNSTAVGYDALYSNTTGGPNDALGYLALYSNTTGQHNGAFGYGALSANTAGSNSSAFGYEALYSNTGNGGGGSAFGSQALYSNTSGYGDAFGSLTLYDNTTGAQNAAFGSTALLDNTTGSYNTAIGFAALKSNQTGSELTCIGYDCSATEDALQNATALGAHAKVGQSNSLVLGGTGEWGVKVGIGTEQPSNILTIGRGMGHPVSDSWETYSSRRWKTNIKTLPDALGKVEQLRGVSYQLKDSGKHEIGVIAEEVGAVVPEVVTYEDNGKDARGVDYSRLTALLIEATKEQQALVRKQGALVQKQQAVVLRQQREISELKQQLHARATKEAALESRLDKLEQHRGETQLASAH